MNDVIDSLFEIKAEYIGENEFVVKFFFNAQTVLVSTSLHRCWENFVDKTATLDQSDYSNILFRIIESVAKCGGVDFSILILKLSKRCAVLIFVYFRD